MLTGADFDNLVVPITDLYERYTQSVINDISRRLVKMGSPTATAAWQLQRLTESGAIYADTLKKIAALTGQSEAVLDKTFKAAGVKSLRFDDSIYKAAGLDPLPLNLSPAMGRVLAAGLQTTNGIVANLTRTTALSATASFGKAADLVWLQVTSGAMDYNSAIKSAIKTVAEDGLWVTYPSGHRNRLDAAMRRTVLTGVGQTTGKMQEIRAAEMGQDLVQTSAHMGARPSHALWQGQIFSLSGTDDKYPDFVESTGYGTGAGLGGWNCRHSWYPYFKGISENAYSKKEQTDFATAQVTFEGEKMSLYDATQKQRYIERTIRKYKREAGALNAGGLDNTFELSKVREWQARMRKFTGQTGLSRQYVREGGRAAKRVVDPSSVVKETHMAAFEKSIIGKVNETAALYDNDGSLLFITDGTAKKVKFSNDQVKQMPGRILSHNHPDIINPNTGKALGSEWLSFSLDDIHALYLAELQEIRAVTQNATYSLVRPSSSKLLTKRQINARWKKVMSELQESGKNFTWDDVSRLFASNQGLVYTVIKQ